MPPGRVLLLFLISSVLNLHFDQSVPFLATQLPVLVEVTTAGAGGRASDVVNALNHDGLVGDELVGVFEIVWDCFVLKGESLLH